MGKVEIKNLKVKDLEGNKGQLIGLPKNPRFIRDDKYKQTLESIKDNPDMLDYRELLVYPLPKQARKRQKYIVIGGNMRLRALNELGINEVVCKIIPQDATIEQLKAYTIKDNASYGQWDMNMLANEWEREDLEGWGLDIMDGWTDETKEQDFDNSNVEIDVDGFDEDMTLKLEFTKEQMEWVKVKLSAIDPTISIAILKVTGYNSGNEKDTLDL